MRGIGIDIIEINRIKKSAKRYGEAFLRRVYTDEELSYCNNRGKLKYPELAARFAAKEAYSKALGTGLTGIGLKQIQIVNNSQGKPHIKIGKRILHKVHLSLSHSKDFAVASVFIEG